MLHLCDRKIAKVLQCTVLSRASFLAVNWRHKIGNWEKSDIFFGFYANAFLGYCNNRIFSRRRQKFFAPLDSENPEENPEMYF